MPRPTSGWRFGAPRRRTSRRTGSRTRSSKVDVIIDLPDAGSSHNRREDNAVTVVFCTSPTVRSSQTMRAGGNLTGTTAGAVGAGRADELIRCCRGAAHRRRATRATRSPTYLVSGFQRVKTRDSDRSTTRSPLDAALSGADQRKLVIQGVTRTRWMLTRRRLPVEARIPAAARRTHVVLSRFQRHDARDGRPSTKSSRRKAGGYAIDFLTFEAS